MDDANLKDLLRTTSNRQFWIKPWGSREFPDQPDAQSGNSVLCGPSNRSHFFKKQESAFDKGKETFFSSITSECLTWVHTR
jgi:hypothetical protein